MCVCVRAGADNPIRGAGNQIGAAGAADLGRGLAQMGNLTSLALYLYSAWPVRWRVCEQGGARCVGVGWEG